VEPVGALARFWPTWSPDGTRIAFTRQITTELIWAVNADGTGQHALTSERQGDQPAWRPKNLGVAILPLPDPHGRADPSTLR
jgi:Tol biopolymer transport system component